MVTKQTAFRFTDEDLLVLDAVQTHLGVISRVEAVRVLLRQYIRDNGLKLRKNAVKVAK